MHISVRADSMSEGQKLDRQFAVKQPNSQTGDSDKHSRWSACYTSSEPDAREAQVVRKGCPTSRFAWRTQSTA